MLDAMRHGVPDLWVLDLREPLQCADSHLVKLDILTSCQTVTKERGSLNSRLLLETMLKGLLPTLGAGGR